MITPRPIVIDAFVAEQEAPVLVAACEQLDEALRAASGTTWPLELRFEGTIATIGSASRPTLAVISLFPELAREGPPPADLAARWAAAVAKVVEAVPAVFLCTIFRHVAGDAAAGAGPRLVERIRRLDLLALQLSHDTGAHVLDIDRVLAHFGARDTRADYRLASPVAVEVAAHAVVAGVLAVGLDDVVPPDVLERAVRHQGPLRDLYGYVDRRLRSRANREEPAHRSG